jgi:hypothetical protein
MGYRGDSYSFTDIFGERPWLDLKAPATLSINMLQLLESAQWKASLARRNAASASKSKKLSGASVAVVAPQVPKLYQLVNVEMQMPLSAEGYKNLLDSIDR